MNEVDFYQDYIRSEEERLKKQRPEQAEAIAAEMARRGFLGGQQHISALGTQLSKEADYLSQLRGREAELKMALLKEEIAKREAKEEAKKQRRYEMLLGAAQLLASPYKYTPSGEAKLGYQGVWDLLKRVAGKTGKITKSNYELIRNLLIKNKPKDKAYEFRPILGDITLHGFDSRASIMRPKGSTPKLLPQNWRESLKVNF